MCSSALSDQSLGCLDAPLQLACMQFEHWEAAEIGPSIAPWLPRTLLGSQAQQELASGSIEAQRDVSKGFL